ncbi:MAG: leucine-rich repeat domain-containing protein [Lachnospiraceae bacterium]|nr:leucine-rich repeat domain-containing protein [Lachnospiraceae bacterium]
MRHYDKETGLFFDIRDGKAFIADADKTLTEVVIPSEFMGHGVYGIDRKAFLGCRLLRNAVLPDSIKSVGEWAFASCTSLVSFSFGASYAVKHDPELKEPEEADPDTQKAGCTFLKGVFKNDNRLESILIAGRSHDSSRLLAKAVTVMDAEYLLETEAVGSAEWFYKWDQKLLNILNLKDDEGYHLYVLCGEEDLHFDYDEYLEFNRRKKSGLSMLRLLYRERLDPGLEDILKTYVKDHSVGRESEAAWSFVLSEHGDDIDYYRLLLELNGIDRGNLDKALSDLSDRHAEAKAYLINYFNGNDQTEDYFDSLLL